MPPFAQRRCVYGKIAALAGLSVVDVRSEEDRHLKIVPEGCFQVCISVDDKLCILQGGWTDALIAAYLFMFAPLGLAMVMRLVAVPADGLWRRNGVNLKSQFSPLRAAWCRPDKQSVSSWKCIGWWPRSFWQISQTQG